MNQDSSTPGLTFLTDYSETEMTQPGLEASDVWACGQIKGG